MALLDAPETIEHLLNARALIEKGWVQGHWSLDKNEMECPSTSSKACYWCAEGALNATYPKMNHAYEMLQKAAENLGYTGYVAFNDDPRTTQADVLQLFDDAIELAEIE